MNKILRMKETLTGFESQFNTMDITDIRKLLDLLERNIMLETYAKSIFNEEKDNNIWNEVIYPSQGLKMRIESQIISLTNRR